MEPADNKPYIRETIEGKPRAPFWKKLLLTVFLALVFGAVAAITFVFGKDLASRFVTTADTETAESVIFPPDEPDRSEAETTAPQESSADEVPGTEGTEATASAPETSWETKDPAESMRAMIESMIAADQPDVADLAQLYRAAYGLVRETGSSLVTVNIARRGTDAYGTEYTYEEQSFGVIVAVTSKEILILTPYAESSVSDGSFSVRFSTGAPADAYTKSTDRISGLTMLAVAVRGLEDTVKDKVRAIELGNSFNCTAGQPVVAMGAPAGAGGSVRYGILTHLSTDVAAIDNTVRLLHTDMSSLSGSRGFLIDLDGRLVGWFDEPLSENGCITAVGISDIKIYLQNLSNGLSTAYLGITGQSLNAEMQERLGVTENGVFILSCIDDGPAMLAGLMSGDILISISGEPVTGMLALKNRLLDMNIEQTVKITVLRASASGYQPLDYDVHLERR